MTTGQIVAIVVLVLLVALAVAAVMIFRRRSPGQRRLEAAQHRREAEQRRASAERLEAEAAQRAERARTEQAQAAELAAMARHDREVAEKAMAEATRLDPDHDRPAEPAARQDADEQQRRRLAEYRPEPIVAGAAAGLLDKRRDRQDADGHRDEPAVPAQRPAPAEERTKDRRTVGEHVEGTADRSGARRDQAPTAAADGDAGPGGSTAAPRPTGDTTTVDESRPHHPVRTLADRIMGRS